jgi:hypothetical protein
LRNADAQSVEGESRCLYIVPRRHGHPQIVVTRGVSWSSSYDLGLFSHIADKTCEPKIQEDQLIIISDHDVLWSNVPVHYTSAMHIVQNTCKLVDPVFQAFIQLWRRGFDPIQTASNRLQQKNQMWLSAKQRCWWNTTAARKYTRQQRRFSFQLSLWRLKWKLANTVGDATYLGSKTFTGVGDKEHTPTQPPQ